MEVAILVIVIVIVVVAFLVFYFKRQQDIKRRQTVIDDFEFPQTIRMKIAEKYPHLSQSNIDLVMKGLREYFHVCNLAGNRMVSMPSQVVDIAWHEFILYTKKYQQFCQDALGRFLHHTPAEAMESKTQAQAGIKTAWRVSCFRENIQSDSPKRLPLLFAIDKSLGIKDGFHYSLNCMNKNAKDYCAGHIGCGSGCAGGD